MEQDQTKLNALGDLYWKILASLKFEESKVNTLKDIINFEFPKDKEEFNSLFDEVSAGGKFYYDHMTREFMDNFVNQPTFGKLENIESKVEKFLKGVGFLIECYLEK